MGVSFTALGNPEKAIEAYQRAVTLDSAAIHAWNGLGIAYNRHKRYKDASNAFQRAINLDPNFAPAWNGQGDVYADLQQYKLAADAYERASQLDAHSWEPPGNKRLQTETTIARPAWSGKKKVFRWLFFTQAGPQAPTRANQNTPNHQL